MSKQKRLLLVEDDDNLLTMMNDALQAAGFIVDACQSGEEAVKLYDKAIHSLSLVDIEMPGMSGHEVVKSIRDQNPHALVVMLTNSSDPQDLQQARFQNVTDYWLKSNNDISDLVERLKQLVR